MKAFVHTLASTLLCTIGACTDLPEDDDIARHLVGPAGGLIHSIDGVLSVAIPPGALERELEFLIQRSNEAPAVLGPAYIVQPNPEIRFDVTVTIHQTLPDDSSTLAVGAIDPTAFEQRQGRWEALPRLRIDPTAEIITGLDDRVSIFYALVDEADLDAERSDPR